MQKNAERLAPSCRREYTGLLLTGIVIHELSPLPSPAEWSVNRGQRLRSKILENFVFVFSALCFFSSRDKSRFVKEE